MIEATCAACGTVNRIAETDVPVGAKLVSCSSCKSKVALPAKAAAGPSKPMVVPPIPPKLPTPPKGSATPKASIDLADLPAPKRVSPLAGAEVSKPAPRSALFAGADLPVPKGAAKPPPAQNAALDLDELMPAAPESPAQGFADLPAPKRSSPLGDLPSKPAPASALSDLPAPKAKPPVPSAPPPKPSAALADLPAPKKPAALADLPAPKKPAAGGDLAANLPAPKKPAGLGDPLAKRAGGANDLAADGITDLPTPKGPVGVTDLPAPKGSADLPTPKRAGAQRTPPGGLPTPRPPAGVTDLPAPKEQGGLDLDDGLDLPMPSLGITDLPAPKPGANGDLPAPKGFFDDLPQPAKKQAGGVDLPAPKGFFDDLPAPKPSANADLPAPKGFFDDLPQPVRPAAAQDATSNLFDDLPNPTKSSDASLFDDIQQPAVRDAPGGATAGRGGVGLDAAGLGAAGLGAAGSGAARSGAANTAMGAGDIDLGPVDAGPGLDVAGPELDLGVPHSKDQAFNDLDLSEPSAKGKPIEDGSPIKIKTPAKGAVKPSIPINVPKPAGDLKLDLAEDPHDPARTGRPAATAAATSPKITPKKKAAEVDSPEVRAAKRRRTRIVLVSVLAVAGVGAGGVFFYQRHAAAQAKADEVARQLETAQTALRAEDANHWTRAKSAADQALELDAGNPHALGLAAEAAIAGALDTGLNREARIQQGRRMIQDALGSGKIGPELERAQALAAINAGQAARAVDLLRTLIAKNPKDGWLQLYLGWANLAKGDAAEAVKAFEQASALAPATKLSALYGHGQAKLLVADVPGAKADFEAILQTNKDHICASIALIRTKPTSQSAEQIAELKAVLERKDIASADPRCVVQAYTLIGDVHRSAGRLDMARQSYRDALKLVELDVDTHDGLAAVELRDGKLQLAADHIQKALVANAEHAETLMLQAELDIREGKLPDAQAIIDKLTARQPPLPPLEQANLFVVRGRLLEAKGDAEAAITAYTDGAKLAGELDLTPTMAAVTKLSELAKQTPDPAKATGYRDRARELLQALADRAQEDPQLSTTLGVAYLQSGDAEKAETFLRRAVALKGDDPESKLQLAKALNAANKHDEAIQQLKEAQQLDPKRTDVALELAVTYQDASRHDEAVAAYDKLLVLPDVQSVVRVKAGRYFAQRGKDMIDRAAAQAEPVLAAEPENPGGLYLKAEGLLRANKPEEASLLLTKATDLDPDPQYLDALGRALEGRVKTDSKFIEGARRAYERATIADPKMFHPWLGQGRMLVVGKEWDAAIKPLLEANKLDPTNGEVMYYLGRAYYGLRNSSNAYKKTSAQWLEAALKAVSELDIATRAEAWHLLGDLYDDLNNAKNAIRSFESATRLGEQAEKETGSTPDWLTEDYYELGDLYNKVSARSEQKRAWDRYIQRKPKPGPRKTTAEQALRTSLLRY